MSLLEGIIGGLALGGIFITFIVMSFRDAAKTIDDLNDYEEDEPW